jgi:outer membrane receptor protein involved in Fe transport
VQKSARLISLSFLVSVAFAAAASAGPVTGRVLDPSGRAIAHAGILLVAGNAVLDRAVTEDDGTFRILTEDEGRYELRVAVEGFRAAPVLIDGQGGAQDVGSIRVQVSAFSESVVVSASQIDVPLSQASSSITVITREQLAATQVETVADALRGVPGLTVVATGGRGAVTTVFPRGGESDYSLVLVDGVQANAFGGVFDFAHLPIANVERIEVVRGPQSALFGSNAIGSVVRIITRQDSGTSVHGVLEGGGYGTTRMTAGGSAVRGPWHVNASAERSRSDGMNGRRSHAGDLISNDDYERRNAAVTGGWRDGRRSLEGQVHYGWNERGFPGPFGSNPVGAFGGIDTVSRGANDQWLAAVNGTWQT